MDGQAKNTVDNRQIYCTIRAATMQMGDGWKSAFGRKIRPPAAMNLPWQEAAHRKQRRYHSPMIDRMNENSRIHCNAGALPEGKV
jgi:hypothetical protein